MRASTWGRSTSLTSSSSRRSSDSMRERRSVNSHEARSIIASARRELRISASIVLLSTSDKSAARIECEGNSPIRDGTTPLVNASLNSSVMPFSQAGAARCSSISISRRWCCSAGPVPCVRSRRCVPSHTACTTPPMPFSSQST